MNGFYFDEHIAKTIVVALRRKGIVAVRAVDVGLEGGDDDLDHLPYATQHELVIVTFDRPFAGRTQHQTDFMAMICLSETIRHDYGAIIELLETFAAVYQHEEDAGLVHWLP